MANNIPSTAWEQAVFVCLFIVLVIIILAWMSRETTASRKFQSDQAKDWRFFMENENKKNVEFSLAVKQSLDSVVAVVARLADEVRSNSDEIHCQRSEFNVHDQMERTKLEEMSKRIYDVPGTRRRIGDKKEV